MYVQAPVALPPPELQKPSEAFVLSLLGGIFVVLGGLTIASLGYFFGGFLFGTEQFLYGALGVAVGVVICLGAVLFHENPAHRKVWGIVIIVLSVLSWIVALGGFFLGFILALIGGILALTWEPMVPTPALVWVPSPYYATPLPPPPPPPPLRICLSCGRQIDPAAKFCQACGKAVPE